MSLEDFLKETKSPLLGVQEDQTEDIQNDSQDQEGVGSEEQGGQESVQDVQNQTGSTEEVEADRVLQTQEEVNVEEERQPLRKKLDLQEFLENNKDTFKRYFTEKDTDYTSYDDVEVVKLKMKKENPELSEKQIDTLLEDKYGVGLDIIQIDEENMTPEEIRDYKRTNKAIEAGQAKLLIEAKAARNYLNKLKEEIILPDFEIDDVDPDKIFQEKYNQLVEQENERVEKTVKPTLYNGVKSVDTINVAYDFEDNGGKVALPITYKLTDEDREVLVNSLIYRNGKESDKQYLNSDGSINFQKLLNDEGKYYLHEKLTQVAIKEAVMLTRKNLVKEKLVNYQEAPRNIPNENDQKHPSLAILDMLR